MKVWEFLKLKGKGSVKMNEEEVSNIKNPIEKILKEEQNLYLEDLIKYFQDNKTLNELKEEIVIIKNYKMMCELLREEEKTGNSKKSQNKEWKRYFDFEREGQRYIIKEIYSVPLPKGHYQNPIDIFNEFLICLYIKEECKRNPKNKEEGVTCAVSKLANFVGLINDEFQEKNKARNKVVYDIIGHDKVGKVKDKDFYNKLNMVNSVCDDLPRRYKYRLEKAIKSLKNKKLIIMETAYSGTKIKFGVESNQNIYDAVQENEQIDIYGDKKSDGYFIDVHGEKETTPLTNKEKHKYSEVCKKVLKRYTKRNELGEKVSCETTQDLYKLGLNHNTGKLYIDEYYQELDKEIHKIGYKYIYEVYKFYFHPEYIEEESWKLLNKLECIENNNRLFLEKMIKNAENQMNRDIKKVEESKIKEEEKELKIRALKEENDFKTSVLEELIFMKVIGGNKK